MTSRVFAAVDLGASGGRVVAGIVERDRVELDVVHRFPNGMREIDGHLCWDLSGLYQQVLAGIARVVGRYPHVESIGIDTWGVDYGLLDDGGALLAEPIAYRDDRTGPTGTVIDAVHERIEPRDLYRINGIQFLPFNTIYQLEAEKHGPRWSRARHVVLLPDLLAYWLTGELRTEYTNATTTGLVNARGRDWSAAVLDRLELSPRLFPPIEHAGAVRGAVRSDLCERLGLARSIAVTAVGSHDTASAVAAVPATGRNFAYVSTGTWSLVGVEVDEPILDGNARAANFTNEGGVDRRIRFLRNVAGLWLLQESMRTWAERGEAAELDRLLTAAQALPSGGARVDVDDPAFVAPGDMPARIALAAVAAGFPEPRTPAAIVRCIIDSLAAAYAATARDAARIAGIDVGVIHIVGGGSQNPLLCQLTADSAGVPVVAGPAEATALGNVLVQARAHGALNGSLDDLRARAAQQQTLRRFAPRVVVTPT